jgi:hypothetical protein
MAKCVPYDKALLEADRLEKGKRRRSGDIRRLTHHGKDLPDGRKIHARLWKKLENGVSVWIVNGRLVRSGFDIDFTEGGHDYVYEFVPEGEVWIDDAIEEIEREYFYSTNSTNFTNAIVWPVVGLITKLTQNRVALNIVAATILMNSMKR